MADYIPSKMQYTPCPFKLNKNITILIDKSSDIKSKI